METIAHNESSPLLPTNNKPKAPLLQIPEKLNLLHDRHNRFSFLSFLDDIQNDSLPLNLIMAIAIGIVCGLSSFLYYNLLQFMVKCFWETIPEYFVKTLPFWSPSLHWVWIPVICFNTAFLLGISLKFLGSPGDISYAIKCVHNMGYVPLTNTPSMIVSSLISIAGGCSLGPEAPLLAVCASVAGSLSINVFKQSNINMIRKHTLCGMSCALAAFFGVPLGGALFALEINHRFGYEYYEHALEAIASGTVSLVVFRSLTGLPIGSVYSFTEYELPSLSAYEMGFGIIFGLLGAGIGSLFANGHFVLVKFLKHKKWDENPLKLSVLGAVGICSIGLLVPQTMFWGEEEMQIIGSLSPASKLPHVWPTSGLTNFEITGFVSAMIVGCTKMVAISISVAAGYRGGFIFPFFASGAAFGRSVTFLWPSVPVVLPILCISAGINVSITRTALGTSLILTALAGDINAMAPVLIASLTGLFATYYMVRHFFFVNMRWKITVVLILERNLTCSCAPNLL